MVSPPTTPPSVQSAMARGDLDAAMRRPWTRCGRSRRLAPRWRCSSSPRWPATGRGPAAAGDGGGDRRRGGALGRRPMAGRSTPRRSAARCSPAPSEPVASASRPPGWPCSARRWRLRRGRRRPRSSCGSGRPAEAEAVAGTVDGTPLRLDHGCRRPLRPGARGDRRRALPLAATGTTARAAGGPAQGRCAIWSGRR